MQKCESANCINKPKPNSNPTINRKPKPSLNFNPNFTIDVLCVLCVVISRTFAFYHGHDRKWTHNVTSCDIASHAGRR